MTTALEVSLDEEVRADSLGLAVAVAAVSELQGFEVEDRFAATGRVLPDGRVRTVGNMNTKIELRAKARPGATLLVPVGAGYRLASVPGVADLATAVRRVRETVSADPFGEFELVRTKFGNGDWRGAAERGEPLRRHPALDDDSHLELLSILLCGANHQADTERAEELSEEVAALLSSTAPSEGRARAVAAAAVARIDCFDPEMAKAALELANDPRHAWSATEQVHLNGTAALLAVLEGDLELAVQLRNRNLELASPLEMPRCLGDFADALRRCGELQRAKETIDKALEHGWRSSSLGYVQATLPYLCLHASRIAHASKDLPTATRYLRALRTDIPELRYRADLETHVLARDLQSIRAAKSALPPGMGEAVVINALEQRALLQAGDSDSHQELAKLMNLPANTGAAELSVRLPY